MKLMNASWTRTRALVRVCGLSFELSQGFNIERVVVYLQNPERIELQTRFENKLPGPGHEGAFIQKQSITWHDDDVLGLNENS